jgi:hypothetical protein
MGRIDDVLNVAGHRLGTMEIESALVAHPRVAEAAVVGKPHEIKGEAVFAYVVTRGQRPTGDMTTLTKELRDWVGQQLGPIAKPDEIRFADNLPKTRSGKIMRRLLKTIARGEEITQDVSTLENPAILEQLRGTEVAGSTSRPAKVAAMAAAVVAVRRGRSTAGRRVRRSTTASRSAAARRSAAASRSASGRRSGTASRKRGTASKKRVVAGAARARTRVKRAKKTLSRSVRRSRPARRSKGRRR